MKTVYVIGTFDTKHTEICYIADLIRQCKVPVRTIDVFSKPNPDNIADVSNSEVAAAHPSESDFLGKYTDRGKAVAMMSEAL